MCAYCVQCTNVLQVGLLPAMHRMNETMHTMGKYVSQAMAAAGPDALDRRGMPRSDTPAGAVFAPPDPLSSPTPFPCSAHS